MMCSSVLSWERNCRIKKAMLSGQKPVQSETLAVEGMAEFLRAFHRIKGQANRGLEIEGILVTMDNERTRVSRGIKAQLQQTPGERVRIFTSNILRSIKVPEAVEYRMTICEYEPERVDGAFVQCVKILQNVL